MTTSYTTRKITVPANSTSEMARRAEFFTVLSSSGEFSARVDNGSWFDVEAGLTIRFGAPFHRLELRNQTANELTAKIALGNGDVNDARLVFSGQIATKEQPNGGYNAPHPVTVAASKATRLFLANAKRKQAWIYNDGDATLYVTHRGNVSSETGWPIPPKGHVIMEHCCELYCWHNHTADMKAFLTEVLVS